MPHRFQAFSAEHYITLFVGFAITALLIFTGNRNATSERITRALLSFVCLSSYPFALIAWKNYPTNLENIIPFHLCDLAAFTAGFALITRRPLLLALTYFWGLAATTQALITPAISFGAPSAPFFHFFIQHFAIVATALYVPLVMKWRPTKPFFKTPLIIFCITLIYQGLSLLVNLWLGTNFAFSASPPRSASLIDHLGAWPYYLFSMQLITLIIFFMLRLPFATERSLSLRDIVALLRTRK